MIEVRELTKRYGDAVPVEGLSFSVAPGRVTGSWVPMAQGSPRRCVCCSGWIAPTRGQPSSTAPVRRPSPTPADRRRAPRRASGRAQLSARAHLLVLARSNLIPDTRVNEVLEVRTERRYRLYWAAFWLAMLLPENGGFHGNPAGTTETQADHLLALLQGS